MTITFKFHKSVPKPARHFLKGLPKQWLKEAGVIEVRVGKDRGTFQRKGKKHVSSSHHCLKFLNTQGEDINGKKNILTTNSGGHWCLR